MLSALDKKLWRLFRMRKSRDPTASVRIAIIGNCQTISLAHAMSLLAPGAQVDPLQIAAKSRVPFRMLKAFLRNYDLVFMQDFGPGHFPDGGSDALRAYLGRGEPAPSIVFSAFHPDLVYIQREHAGGPLVESPTGHYHSALSLYAFRQNYSLERALALYRAEVFEQLGYFDLWTPCVDALVAESRRCKIEIESDILRWARQGVFMHSPNHPKFQVLFDVASKMLLRVGVKTETAGRAHFFNEHLGRAENFPLYPDVAERFGEQGGYLFCRSEWYFANGNFRCLGLREFVEASLTLYSADQARNTYCPRVDSWCGNAETVDVLARATARDT